MSTYLEEKYPRWFVYDTYEIAGRPKMENALMTWAKVNYNHCIIAEELLHYVVQNIKNKQDELWEQNKRLKKVEISLSKNDTGFHNNHCRIYIGAQSLSLWKVRDEIA